MTTDNERLVTLRALVLKSQRESLSETEVEELNSLVISDGNGAEVAALLDQICAFTDSGAMDSLPMAELLSEVTTLNAGVTAREEQTTTTASLLGDASAAGARITHRNRSQASVGTPTTKNRIAWVMAIVASYLAVGSLAWSLARSLPSRARSAEAVASSMNAAERPTSIDSNTIRVASSSPQLVSMTACVWRPSGDAVPALGEKLQSGELLKLVEGIAELKIGDGTPGEALVRIEGPASVYVRADGKLGFLEGAMTVKSLGSGSGSVNIDTPMGSVMVDGQSSVGLVARESAGEFHLFTGQAFVKPYQLASDVNSIFLDAGEAVRISSTSREGVSVVKFQASETGFVSTRSAGFDPLDVGEEYVQAVMESAPKMYWRFEDLVGEAPYQIQNQGSAPGMNAIVSGDLTWRQYGENRVAELGAGQASALLVNESWPEKALDEYAIELWLKPTLYHHGEVLCLHDPNELVDGRYQHAMMLEVTAQHYYTHRLSQSPANRFRFVHRALGATQPISSTSLFAEKPYQARAWQHVVAQKQGERQMIWVDGQVAAERENAVPLDANVKILIGQVYPNSGYRRFAGQIDEVAIYDRFLSADEIRKHINAAGRLVADVNSAIPLSGRTQPH